MINKKKVVFTVLVAVLVLAVIAGMSSANLKLEASKSLWLADESWADAELLDHYTAEFVEWPNVKQIWTENKNCGISPINFTALSCMEYVKTEITYHNETRLEFSHTSLTVDGREVDTEAMDVTCYESNNDIICESKNVGDNDFFVIHKTQEVAQIE